MTHYPKKQHLLLSVSVALGLPAMGHAAEGGFIEDTSATLTARNYYFSRDYSDIVGPNQQSKAEEWAQGFILNVQIWLHPPVRSVLVSMQLACWGSSSTVAVIASIPVCCQ